jgi:hypothetical protein
MLQRDASLTSTKVNAGGSAGTDMAAPVLIALDCCPEPEVDVAPM